MKQQVVVLIVPFKDDEPPPESWNWGDIGTLAIAGRVEEAGTLNVVGAGADAVWTVTP